jgi:uncharacterized protein (DUF58 family)
LAQLSSPDTLAGPSTSVRLTGDRDLARRLPLFDVCGLIALAGLVTAIAFRQSDILALTTPFVVVVAAALALWRPVDGVVQIRADRTRIVEGEDVTILVDITSARGIDRVEIELEPSARLLAVGSLRAVTTVKPNSTATLAFTVRAGEWGIARIDKLTIRVSDRFAMFGGELDTRADTTITIGLPEDRISASLEAERFRSIVGSHLSNDRGQGMEIADIRPFQPGDSTRNINWRISNRRQEPWVTLRHPDRSTTVVVIVDAHDGGDDEQRLTQRRSVSAAMALSRGHLALHDRVGLLVVGHTVQWLPPKLGRNQLFQIADHLVAVSNAPEASRRMYRPPAVSTIPNNAIVVAVSPLRDPLMVSLVAEIRSRGNPVSVLVPETEQAGSSSSRFRVTNRTTEQARRLAAVEQKIGLQSLRERGVGIVSWEPDQPVMTVIDSVRQLRMAMARGRSW